MFMMASANFSLCTLRPISARLIAEHRLGGGDGLAGEALAKVGDLGLQRFQRGDEIGFALLIVGFVGGVDRFEVGAIACAAALT